MSDKELWYISQNEEWFNEGPFDSRDEAIAEGKEQYEGDCFYIGKREDVDVLDPVSIVERLYDDAGEEVYDQCGSDASDNWPERRNIDAMRDAGEKIRAIFMELYGQPTVFRIGCTERIDAELAKKGAV